MKAQCSRCGKEITETYPVQYTTIRGVFYRDYLAYGKIRFWHPEQSKGDVPQTVRFCEIFRGGAVMKRLTIPGFKWTSDSIFRDIDRWSLAECLNRLSEYENTGLTPDEINALRERDVAKTPEKVSNSGIRYTDDYICPNCGKHFTGTGIAEFCYHCGQRLKWED